MQCDYVIEKQVPLPAKVTGITGRQMKYPFPQMDVNDSFAVPLDDEKVDGNYAAAVRLRSAASNFKKRSGADIEFTVRTLPDEGIVRVWRTR